MSNPSLSTGAVGQPGGNSASTAGPPQGARAPSGGSDPHAMGERGGPQSLAQKINACAAAKTSVRLDDIVTRKVDLAMFHDSSGVLLTCPQIEMLQKAELTTPYVHGQTIALPSGDAAECDPVPDFLLATARAGGLLPSLKQRLSERRRAT